MIVELVEIPALCASVMVSIHCWVLIFPGQIIFLTLSERISAEVPVRESSPLFLSLRRASSTDMAAFTINHNLSIINIAFCIGCLDPRLYFKHHRARSIDKRKIILASGFVGAGRFAM